MRSAEDDERKRNQREGEEELNTEKGTPRRRQSQGELQSDKAVLHHGCKPKRHEMLQSRTSGRNNRKRERKKVMSKGNKCAKRDDAAFWVSVRRQFARTRISSDLWASLGTRTQKGCVRARVPIRAAATERMANRMHTIGRAGTSQRCKGRRGVGRSILNRAEKSTLHTAQHMLAACLFRALCFVFFLNLCLVLFSTCTRIREKFRRTEDALRSRRFFGRFRSPPRSLCPCLVPPSLILPLPRPLRRGMPRLPPPPPPTRVPRARASRFGPHGSDVSRAQAASRRRIAPRFSRFRDLLRAPRARVAPAAPCRASRARASWAAL